jgi:hypothetical protein
VPASLPALRNNDVHSAGDRLPRLLGAADRVHNDSPSTMHPLDVTARIAPNERHDPQASLKSLVGATVLILGEDKVAANRR